MKHPAKPAAAGLKFGAWPVRLLSVLLLGSLQTACAQPAKPVAIVPPPSSVAIHGSVAQVRIVDRDSGRELPVYRHRGEYWIVGRPGARYGISIMGHPYFAPGRVEAVVSVDGVNVITGQTASVQQAGYILPAGQWHTITGWRKNEREVAAFHFTALPDSYAARTGRPDHVGVIGVALYREKTSPPPAVHHWRQAESATLEDSAPRKSAPAAAEAMRSPAPQGLGTGHGARERSVVEYTTFERRSRSPEQRVVIRYDSHENLVARGVVPRHGWQPPEQPQPFPATPSRGYVPDPPNW